MIISVASGKGGTGKTTIATSLALSIGAQGFLDCDVEAPNAHIFLQPAFSERQTVQMQIPQVDDDRCVTCGRCAEVCQYNAIVFLAGTPLVYPELCHGCGSCSLNCPKGAIAEVPRELGILEGGFASAGIKFARGLLNVGEPMAVPVIRQLKSRFEFSASDIVIRDAPPGTSCPVVETMRGSDYVLLVTEPTPFGMHDLKLAVQLIRELDLPAGVIINRDNNVDKMEVDSFCQDAVIPILMRIPFDRAIAEGIARGKTLIEIRPEYRARFQDLFHRITQAPVTTEKSYSLALGGVKG